MWLDSRNKIIVVEKNSFIISSHHPIFSFSQFLTRQPLWSSTRQVSPSLLRLPVPKSPRHSPSLRHFPDSVFIFSVPFLQSQGVILGSSIRPISPSPSCPVFPALSRSSPFLYPASSPVFRWKRRDARCRWRNGGPVPVWTTGS